MYIYDTNSNNLFMSFIVYFYLVLQRLLLQKILTLLNSNPYDIQLHTTLQRQSEAIQLQILFLLYPNLKITNKSIKCAVNRPFYNSIMNKIYRLGVLSYLRSLNVSRINATATRLFSTEKDSDGGNKDSTSSESPDIEKEIQTKTNNDVEKSEIKLSGFAQSYEKFSHIDDKREDKPETFASLLRHSKFIDVNISPGRQ